MPLFSLHSISTKPSIFAKVQTFSKPHSKKMSSFTSSATTAAVSPPFYMEEKWKLPKKGGPIRSRSSSSSCLLMRNSSERRCSFTRKCAKLVKEQRARFYIMRRCVTMLVCWHNYNDS